MSTRTGSAGAPAFKRGESLPDAIANHIARSVAARRLAGGERIVETALAAELGVSRVPVREALKILATQGIVAGGGHRGYKVVALTERRIASVQEARIATESLFLRDAIEAWRAGTSDIAVLDERIAAMRRAATHGDVPEMLEADVAFHTAICEAAHNPIFTMLWTAIARHVLIILNLARFGDVDLLIVVRRHEALRDQIRAAVVSGEPTDVRALLESHFLAEPRERARVRSEVSAAPLAARAAAKRASGKRSGAAGGEEPSRRASRRRPSGTNPS